MAIPIFKKNDPQFSTRAIMTGSDPHMHAHMDVVPPISLSTTFAQDSPAIFKGFEYSRAGNPSRFVLEVCLSSLEEAKYGFIFSSGTAVNMVITGLCNAGDHVVSMDYVYGGTNSYFTQIASRFKLESTFVDCSIIEKVENALRPNTQMVWIESPTNPTLKIVDIEAVAKVLKKHNEKHNKGAFLVVDNTFLSSYFQRPLTLGADIVFHFCSQYMNGHSDVAMGAVCTNHDDLAKKLRFLQNSVGALPSPFDCYLVKRSLNTLQLRMEQHQKTGFAVASFLENHPCVEKVIHPGLSSHPQHKLALSQSFGHSGMVSFYIKGDLTVSKKFFENIKLFTLAESLGGYESLAELPFTMSHAAVNKEHRENLGITENLIRLSCGLEQTEDLIEDLDHALKKACGF